MTKAMYHDYPVWFGVTCEAWDFDLSEGSFDFDEACRLLVEYNNLKAAGAFDDLFGLDCDFFISCWAVNADGAALECCGHYHLATGLDGVRGFEFLS